jgi:hypothetical protein
VGEIKHGTVAGYTKGKCRCDACKAANAEYMDFYRANKRNKPIPDRVHGTANGYTNYHCRCDACKTAHAEHVNQYRGPRKRTKDEENDGPQDRRPE